MRSLFVIITSLFLVFALSACEEMSGDLPGKASAASEYPEGYCGDLFGSWEMISMEVTTPDSTYEQDYTEVPTLKILNRSHWMFIRQSAETFIFAQGGPYTLEDGVYTEIVGYSADPNNIGKEYVFECGLQGDSLWYHKGDLGGIYVDEVWRRVGGAEPAM